jgi:hypothetical protein
VWFSLVGGVKDNWNGVITRRVQRFQMKKLVNVLGWFAWLAWSAYLLAKPLETLFFQAQVFSDQELQACILQDWIIPYYNGAGYLLVAAVLASLIVFVCRRLEDQRRDKSVVVERGCQKASMAALILLVFAYSITLWLDPSPSIPVVFAVICAVVLTRRMPWSGWGQNVKRG